ncbi:MAG TPA: hypothetical protein VFX95_03720, partial [Caulobacteraceae bacterium]|nr:hypothetical protein [Caulobacteraceae bacterium]
MLKVRPFPIDTFRQNVVVLHRTCSALRPERLRGTRKVEVRVNGRTILADIVISDDQSLVGCDEVGLSQPAFRRLAATPGDAVEISP